MSLIEDKPRSASAIAYEDTQLLAVNKENFARMVKTQPQIITRLTQLLAERIWFIYKQLANTLLTDSVGRLYDALLIQLERNRIPIRSGEAYTFDFGTKELINMVGMPMGEGKQALRELLKNSRIKALDGKIHITDKEEIDKQAKYYRKMQKIERARQVKKQSL
jgi:CRP-like cAMP-binding protein